MRVAVIAPGAMGAGVAKRLHARGAPVAVTLAAWADVILSILPPGDEPGLAARLAPVLCPRGAGMIFADCNAVSPETMHAVAAALPGVRVADIGIIGGPPKGDDAGPRLYASGEAADQARPAPDGLVTRLATVFPPPA